MYHANSSRVAACSCWRAWYEVAVSSKTRFSSATLLTTLFEVRGLLEGGQQQPLAFGEIVGKKVRSVHVAEYCSNSREQEKPSSSFFFNQRGDISAAAVLSANPDH